LQIPLQILTTLPATTMHAEIIAIGDEITSGQLLDTNTQWLSQRHEELGLRVLYHTSVGDDLDAMVGVLRQAVGRADVIVTTGGLGPTADDLTRQAIAKAAGRELRLHPDVLESIRQLYARRKREMPERNVVQAMFPAGSRMIPNPNGTAPGVAIDVPRPDGTASHLFALPGVPAEMMEMWYQTVAESIRKLGGGQRVVRHRVIKTFGTGESNVEAMLPDLIRRGRIPEVGINASGASILLRITAEGATEEECDAAIEPTVAVIHQCLGNLVFGEGDEELQDAVTRLLRQQGKTLSVCEWGSGGQVAQWFSEVADAAGYFLGGIVVAGDGSLRSALDVPEQLVAQASADSGPLVSEMARRCRVQFGSDLALAVGRYPKFDPSRSEPDSVHFALADAGGVQVQSFPFAGHPALLKILNAKRAVNLVRLALLDAANA
jgi:nicotinamide-nucleotide amidase